jgi:excisionase family DNA binding protein
MAPTTPRRHGGEDRHGAGRTPRSLPDPPPLMDLGKHRSGEAGRQTATAPETPGNQPLATFPVPPSPGPADAGMPAGSGPGQREFSPPGSLPCLPRLDQQQQLSGTPGTRKQHTPETSPVRRRATSAPAPSLTTPTTVRHLKENVPTALGLAPAPARPSAPASRVNRPWPALYRLAPTSTNTRDQPETGRRAPADQADKPRSQSHPVTTWRSHTMADTRAATGTPGQHGDVTLLTVEQAAKRLSIGRTTMFALLKSGDILSVRIGRLRRVPVRALDAFAAQLAQQQHAA